MRICSINGCGDKHYARDWCYRHYMQWFRTGRIRWVHRPSFEESFWAKVHRTRACWLWQGTVFATGYGQVRADGKTQIAHRVAWRLVNGAVPPAAVLHHRCHNKLCVRPDHLELVDRQEHADAHKRTGTASGHGHETHCPRGHPYDEANTYIEPKGSRHCRTCMREQKRDAYWRRRGAEGKRPPAPSR